MSQKPDGYVGGWSDADSKPLASAATPSPINHCAVFCGEACDCGWRVVAPARPDDAMVAATLKAARAC